MDTLPREIMLEILGRLDWSSFLAFTATCSKYRALMHKVDTDYNVTVNETNTGTSTEVQIIDHKFNVQFSVVYGTLDGVNMTLYPCLDNAHRMLHIGWLLWRNGYDITHLSRGGYWSTTTIGDAFDASRVTEWLMHNKPVQLRVLRDTLRDYDVTYHIRKMLHDSVTDVKALALAFSPLSKKKPNRVALHDWLILFI